MINVRRANAADLPEVLEIYNEAVLTTTATYDYQPQTMEQRMAWFEDHERHGHPVFVAVNKDRQVVGWSSLSPYHARKGYRFTMENSVYVGASHRGRGIGKQLLAPLIPAAREAGWHAIIAAIDAQNQASIRLHAGFGFVEVGLFKEVGFKFNRWLDVVYMERMVEPGPGLATVESRNSMS